MENNKTIKKESRIKNNIYLLYNLFLLIKQRKKWWLLPLLVILFLLSLFVSLTGNQSILPAIYTLF